jgi:uncharacterized iron-regulated membrane protein
MTSTLADAGARRAQLTYRTLWRWHFYAGLFCLPFIILLSITGALYLFRPDIEAALDRPYDHLALNSAPAPIEAQLAAAVAAAPAGAKLRTLEIRQDGSDALRVVLGQKGDAVRVLVHPQTLQILKILKIERDADRPMNFDKRIHGELLMGDRGAIIVELAANWAIVMIITGLYLWWPRGADIAGLAGLAWPRLNAGSRIFWRDVHAVTGVWISGLALFLLLTGLPWTKVWGEGLKQARDMIMPAAAKPDWVISRAEEHRDHQMADMMAMPGMEGVHHHEMSQPAPDLEAMARTVRALNLQGPVLLAPPSTGKGRFASPNWTARSETPNRPLQTTLTLDPSTGQVLSRKGFADKNPIDQAVGYGVAIHEGQLFGRLNQALGVLAAVGLITLSVSAFVLWWSKRPAGALGAPPPLEPGEIRPGLGLAILALALFLPVLGVSLIVVGAVEHLVLRRIAPVRRWLSLRAPLPIL